MPDPRQHSVVLVNGVHVHDDRLHRHESGEGAPETNVLAISDGADGDAVDGVGQEVRQEHSGDRRIEVLRELVRVFATEYVLAAVVHATHTNIVLSNRACRTFGVGEVGRQGSATAPAEVDVVLPNGSNVRAHRGRHLHRELLREHAPHGLLRPDRVVGEEPLHLGGQLLPHSHAVVCSGDEVVHGLPGLRRVENPGLFLLCNALTALVVPDDHLHAQLVVVLCDWRWVHVPSLVPEHLCSAGVARAVPRAREQVLPNVRDVDGHHGHGRERAHCAPSAPRALDVHAADLERVRRAGEELVDDTRRVVGVDLHLAHGLGAVDAAVELVAVDADHPLLDLGVAADDIGGQRDLLVGVVVDHVRDSGGVEFIVVVLMWAGATGATGCGVGVRLARSFVILELLLNVLFLGSAAVGRLAREGLVLLLLGTAFDLHLAQRVGACPLEQGEVLADAQDVEAHWVQCAEADNWAPQAVLAVRVLSTHLDAVHVAREQTREAARRRAGGHLDLADHLVILAERDDVELGNNALGHVRRGLLDLVLERVSIPHDTVPLNLDVVFANVLDTDLHRGQRAEPGFATPHAPLAVDVLRGDPRPVLARRQKLQELEGRERVREVVDGRLLPDALELELEARDDVVALEHRLRRLAARCHANPLECGEVLANVTEADLKRRQSAECALCPQAPDAALGHGADADVEDLIRAQAFEEDGVVGDLFVQDGAGTAEELDVVRLDDIVHDDDALGRDLPVQLRLAHPRQPHKIFADLLNEHLEGRERAGTRFLAPHTPVVAVVRANRNGVRCAWV
eukprot:PhM_4_TR1322/c0_g1_i1/m.101036